MNSIRRLLRKIGIHAIRTRHPAARFVDFPPRSMFDFILLKTANDLAHLRFVQIGANDGKLLDPLAPYLDRLPWTGVMVEPLPASFRALQTLRGGQPGLHLINAALDVEPGRRVMFDLAQDVKAQLPTWASGLASFSREHVGTAAQELGLQPSSVVSREVQTIHWQTIWEILGAHCDLLVLDTEGFDITLLQAADLRRQKPNIILFEHACVSDDERYAFYRELNAIGYELCTEAGDSIAFLPSQT